MVFWGVFIKLYFDDVERRKFMLLFHGGTNIATFVN